MSQFEWLGVCPEIVQAVEEMGWLLPTAVQEEAVPLVLTGGDVMIAAETGSGKTGAFAIPVIQLIHEARQGVATVEAPSSAPASSTQSPPPTWCQEGLLVGGVRLDAADRDDFFAISPDGLVGQTRQPGAWGGARATVGVLRGAYYFEIKCVDEGLSRVGVSAENATWNVGMDGLSFGYGGTAMKSHGRKFEKYGLKFRMGDTVGCVVDRTAHTVSFWCNNSPCGSAFQIPPRLHGTALYPACVLKNAQVEFKFGGVAAAASGRQAFQPPAGAKPWALVGQQDAYTSAKGGKRGGVKGSTVGGQRGQGKARSAEGGRGGPVALVVEPTQELAMQVAKQVQQFKCLLQPPINHMLISGSVGHSELVKRLREGDKEEGGGVQMVIGTLGRITSLLKKGALDLSNCLYFVADEADSMIDQGNKKQLMQIIQALPSKDPRFQMVICSATLHSPAIRDLSAQVCRDATWVDLKGKDAVPETVDHCMLLVDPQADQSWRQKSGKSGVEYRTDGVHANASNENANLLSNAVKLLKPRLLVQLISAFKMEQAIIFCRTRLDCDNLHEFLNKLGVVESGKENVYSSAVLHGGKGSKRQENLDAFKDGFVRFLICTDVAARGIDVTGLPFVINMTLPEPSEQYIHRVGRVGRAGSPGLAISLVSSVPERVWWHNCSRRDKGAGCRNTALLEEGGCNKWFNELRLKAEIEARISKAKGGEKSKSVIPWMDRSNLLKGRHQLKKLLGSSKVSSKIEQQSAAHVQHLRPTVQALAQLETLAQQNYFAMMHRSMSAVSAVSAVPPAGGAGELQQARGQADEKSDIPMRPPNSGGGGGVNGNVKSKKGNKTNRRGRSPPKPSSSSMKGPTGGGKKGKSRNAAKKASRQAKGKAAKTGTAMDVSS